MAKPRYNTHKYHAAILRIISLVLQTLTCFFGENKDEIRVKHFPLQVVTLAQ